MKLSLIITYRQRQSHLITQIEWWKKPANKYLSSICEVILVEVAQLPSGWIQEHIQDTKIRYIHLPITGLFHKTRALNLGLQHAKGEWVVPFDVDLIPIGNTLEKHLEIAELSPRCLISGYRVMSAVGRIDVNNIPAVVEQTAIAPEDQPTALWKHLIRGERFGVVPFFGRERLLEIGGWDEGFVGWGGEDQDIIERYLDGGYYLCRAPE